MSTVIGVFDNQNDAESAVREVQNLGIDENNISIVAKEDNIENEQAGNENVNRQDLTDGAVTGGALGGVAGLLAGAGALTIPGIGPVIAAGPISAGLTGVAAGGLAGSLVDLGVDEERGQHYEKEVKEGAILAAVETDSDNINDIASYMRRNGARDVETH